MRSIGGLVIRVTSWPGRTTIAALALTTLVACDDTSITNSISPLNAFHQTNLVADATGSNATTVDANAVNPWGIAFGPTGTLWVSNNGTGTSTLYDASGNKLTTTVTVPGGSGSGTPTGVVFNSTSDFVIPSAGKALFIFAGEDGTIAAWNASTTTGAMVVANRTTANAVYKGIAIASNSGANFLYLTDFKNNHIDVFDGSFAFVKSFTDATVPAGYAPFGIANIGGQLFVTFAKQLGPDNEDDDPGVGNGFVDVFNSDGSLSKRFTSNGRLNSPWAIAQAPSGFGPFSGAILVGNFGDGTIGAYDPATGSLIDVIRDANAKPIAIDGLWGLTFGPGAASTTLYFAAGPSDESHGLVGTLTPP
jgi:uncharacterized protein (TIGR03118 family)